MRTSNFESETVTGGFVFVHSAPRAVARHLDWALTRVMGEGRPNDWRPQPASRGDLCTHFGWQGPYGSGAELASELAGWRSLRFEVTETGLSGLESSRWMYTPSLGIKRVQVDAAGNTLVSENQLRTLKLAAGPDATHVLSLIDDLLGAAWDEELEPFRRFGLTSETRLNRVG